MHLELIFYIVFLIFLSCFVFFIFNKPKLIERWQAISVCLLGMLIYGTLFGLILYDEFHYAKISEGNIVVKTQNINKKSSKKDDNKRDNDKKGKIIGNTDSKIYHVPGSTYYEKELEKESNNEYFDTVEEAEKAGYRAPKR